MNTSGVVHPGNEICNTATQDCLPRIPTGIMSTACDHLSGWSILVDEDPEGPNQIIRQTLGFHGLGGTLFCNIPNTASLTATVTDFQLGTVAAVTYLIDIQTGVNWYRMIDADSNAGPTWSGALTQADFDCISHPQDVDADHPETDPDTGLNDNTRVGLFNRGPVVGQMATTGTSSLTEITA